jgi:hypothetical protein
MSHNDHHLQDAELGPVIARLEAEKPTASELELGLIRQRVRDRVAPSARRSRRTKIMRSRLAIIAMLVFGGLLSTSGGALAVSGFTSQQGNAAQGQYGDVQGEEDTGEGGQGVLGDEDTEGGPAENGGGGGEGAVQPTRQVEAGAQGSGGDELPFTGFAAIPILLGGVALLTGGLVLRRRTAHDE